MSPVEILIIIIKIVAVYVGYILILTVAQWLLMRKNGLIIPYVSFFISLPLAYIASIISSLDYEYTMGSLIIILFVLIIMNIPTFITNRIYRKYLRISYSVEKEN
jgi:hypothetical protein